MKLASDTEEESIVKSQQDTLYKCQAVLYGKFKDPVGTEYKNWANLLDSVVKNGQKPSIQNRTLLSIHYLNLDDLGLPCRRENVLFQHYFSQKSFDDIVFCELQVNFVIEGCAFSYVIYPQLYGCDENVVVSFISETVSANSIKNLESKDVIYGLLLDENQKVSSFRLSNSNAVLEREKIKTVDLIKCKDGRAILKITTLDSSQSATVMGNKNILECLGFEHQKYRPLILVDGENVFHFYYSCNF